MRFRISSGWAGWRAPAAAVMGAAFALAAGCGGGGPAEESFEIVFDDLEASLFSVWGRAADDVWVVGADPGDGPLVLHYDGEAWTQRDTGASGDLWWVSGGEGEIWMSGEGGTIVRYDEGADEFEVTEAPGAEDDLTLFGIFPAATDEVWAVGGVQEDGREGRAYRYDGSEWAEVADMPEGASDDPLFKVWGRGPDDLWIVGLGDVAMHWDGEDWREMETGRRLLTVHGNDDEVIAVGGFETGYVVGAEGDEDLGEVTPPEIEEMMGVWVEPDGSILTGGIYGSLWRREAGEWAPVGDAPTTPAGTAYHAVFVDAEGGMWAVGGDVQVRPFDRGVLSHRGEPVSSEIR